MAATGRRDGAFAMLGIAAAVLLTGCATGPAPLHDDEIQAVMAAFDPEDVGSLTVGDALPIAPDGTIGMVDARSSSGKHDEHVAVEGTPGEEYADWPVIAVCGSGGVVPSVLLVALPPEELSAFEERPWGTSCDLTASLD